MGSGLITAGRTNINQDDVMFLTYDSLFPEELYTGKYATCDGISYSILDTIKLRQFVETGGQLFMKIYAQEKSGVNYYLHTFNTKRQIKKYMDRIV